MFEVMQSLLVQYSAMKSNNIKEQVSWMLECSFHLFKYSDILDGKLDRITKETKLFVLLMLTNHSYKIKHIMNFVGKPKVVNCNEIIELLENCDSPSNRFALAARKIKKKNQNYSKKKVHSNGCYYCTGDHAISHCKKYKANNSDTFVFKKQSKSLRKNLSFGLRTVVFTRILDKDSWIYDS